MSDDLKRIIVERSDIAKALRERRLSLIHINNISAAPSPGTLAQLLSSTFEDLPAPPTSSSSRISLSPQPKTSYWPNY